MLALATPVQGRLLGSLLAALALTACAAHQGSSHPTGLDRDGDGLANSVDLCVDEPEDFDSFEDQDGCPDPDNDHDGIPDIYDQCPVNPEDLDGFEDQDGCPDNDNDRDGNNDVDDKCPNEAETFNDYEDEDGCPDAGPIHPVNHSVHIQEHLLFVKGSATLTPESAGVLEGIAEILLRAPSIRRLSIHGHSARDEPSNAAVALSLARAEAVRDVLVARGFESDRIRVIGHGHARPAIANRTSEAYKANRRVEFSVEVLPQTSPTRAGPSPNIPRKASEQRLP